MFPKCFDSQEQWDEWQKLAEESGHDVDDYCRDCSSAYQKQMLEQDRCEHPEVVFVMTGVGKDLEVIGVRAGSTTLEDT